MLVVVATVAVVVMTHFVGVNRIEEPSQSHERSVRDAHQENGDAGRPPRQVGKMGVDLVHFRVVLLVGELEFNLFLLLLVRSKWLFGIGELIFDLFLLFLVRSEGLKLFAGRIAVVCSLGVVCIGLVVGLVGLIVGLVGLVVSLVGLGIVCRCFGVLLRDPFVVQFLFVPVSMLDVGHTNAHRPEGKDADGEEDPADEDGAHPHAVLDVRFTTAHSSAPLVSAVQSFSFRVGPSCL